AEREMLGGDHAGVGLAGSPAADEAVLRPPVAVDPRIGERVPVGPAIDEAGHATAEQVIERLGHCRLRSQARWAGTTMSAFVLSTSAKSSACSCFGTANVSSDALKSERKTFHSSSVMPRCA